MIPWAKPTLHGKEKEYVVDALDSTWISGGKYVERLERELPEILGARHGVAVSNGTTALHLAFLACGIGPGDEVIVPGYSFVAVANMVMAVGATPVFADVDADTWLLDPGTVEVLITGKTKAISPVHLYGNVAAMDAIMVLADRHGITVIEDAAEAAFSRFGGRCAGTIGALGTLSFHATKTLTTGEGGMVLTDDAALHRTMILLRDHGMRKSKRYWHDAVGYNFRMTNLQAAMGCAQLDQLDFIRGERKRVYAAYRSNLSGDARFRIQHFEDAVDPVVWTFGVRLQPDGSALDRDRVIERLGEAGIETRPGFYPFSEMPPYDCPDLPVTLDVSRNVILLPTYPDLDNGTIAHICDRFRSVLAEEM